MIVHGPRNSPTCKYSFLFLDLWHAFGYSLSVTDPRDSFDSPTRPFFSLIHGN
ncbi:hypothetical protein RchiOBHm_Chr0c31g0501291 [Rosa chinensis]|uniref:Uncharacterized protein n=1 Tax=Rosa chinensis TaxID=74649 RepID=A0A2P6RSN6_ROSCH|nr:hypothetical protein RchiOBHm_Chr2g0121791 [Rosa chinensis]PRQ60836.1 hypothetical protein RchiOBHm_Chr0c36g0502931 [Rosa chinensis]PRQ60859.1 hypothetical protein RchiOBHm_Chr0c31g0501291 [Rosa chinensis]